jgi:hypothetical protein
MSPVFSQPSGVIASAVGLGIVEIALHHVEAAHADLAGLTRRHRLSGAFTQITSTPGIARPAVVAISSGSSSAPVIETTPQVSVRP